MVNPKNRGVVNVFCRSSNIEAIFENKGIWSRARHLLNMPIEAVEAHYEEKRKELDRLTNDLANATLKNFHDDETYNAKQFTKAQLADTALKLNLAPKNKQEDYKRLRSMYFVICFRSYGKIEGIKRGVYVCEFDMLPEETVQGGRGKVSVWKKLPLENLAGVYTRPENSSRVVELNKKHGLSVKINEIMEQYQHIYRQGLYGNK